MRAATPIDAVAHDPAVVGGCLLDVQDVNVRFGGVVALDGISFQVKHGEIAGLIGPNGAGKTTLFNCLSRIYTCDSGSIRFDGENLLRFPVHRIAALGIGRTFQNVALFSTMSVLDNIRVGRHCRARSGFASNALRLPATRRETRAADERVGDLVGFLALEAVANRVVSQLPFAMQKRVELARALAGEPKLLLLDEPASGLNHEEVGILAGLIRDIRARLGVTVLLVEHHMGLVMGVSDKVVALDFGRKIAEGTPEQVQGHADVIRAYLGSPA